MKRENKREQKKILEGKKEPKKNAAEKYSRQTKIAVIMMIILITSIFIANWIAQGSRKFDYNGMKFYEEKEGEIVFYKSLLGYATAGGESVPFILKLRNNPRELENIPVNGKVGKLQKNVLISLSPEIAECPDTFGTMMDFSMTLKAFGMTAGAATTDRNFSREHNTTLADCRNAKDKTVIVMKEGNETKITQYIEQNPLRLVGGGDSVAISEFDCYTIELKGCEIREGFEKFILEYISNSMKM